MQPIPKDQEEVKVSSGRLRVPYAENLPDKVHTWPYLVRAEFISGCVLLLVLLLWSIVIDAPMEEPADPTRTPNPSKAPWYFLGLQEMLVYFDPWIAGVVLPSLIIVGLMVVPYIDINPKGNGYYTWSERKFAVTTFLFGFIALWCGMIIIGVFFRGPGWNLFWPWDYWDAHKVVALTNVNLPYLLGFRTYESQLLVGAAAIGAWFSLVPAFWFLFKDKIATLQALGVVRYNVVAFLFITMLGLVFKMILRLGFNVKYILVTPWLNI
jgi:hypothetical protein